MDNAHISPLSLRWQGAKPPSGGFCTSGVRMITNVYIDGFNFYYGALKGTPYKWLDLDAVFRRLLPSDNIVKIRYFTARVSSRPDDPQQAVNQETYLRALNTMPLIEIHFGHYITRPTRIVARQGDGTTVSPVAWDRVGVVCVGSVMMPDCVGQVKCCGVGG